MEDVERVVFSIMPLRFEHTDCFDIYQGPQSPDMYLIKLSSIMLTIFLDVSCLTVSHRFGNNGRIQLMLYLHLVPFYWL